MDETECGREFEHDAHLYETRDGKKVCDGKFRSKKVK